MINMQELIKLVQLWAKEKGLLDNPNVSKQLNQLSEEVGELTSDLVGGNTKEALIELGDNVVVLIIIATQLEVCDDLDWIPEDIATGTQEENLLNLSIVNGVLHSIVKKQTKVLYIESIRTMLYYLSNLAEYNDVNIPYCLHLAYEKIKDRKGKNVGGQFIKQKDS